MLDVVCDIHTRHPGNPSFFNHALMLTTRNDLGELDLNATSRSALGPGTKLRHYNSLRRFGMTASDH
ncbi:hypothetical protein ANCDUO_14554 [Ancylostoma duodenale]|uniref:Uncharacterized protein n=1 Tax=Ancylostoma duodenale TaxID=51022 RepID=A0A0C2CG09_9BILA|nr:hypothetical protein ANCDUO_14554 [Ancylostoma duodenale]